MIGRRRLVIAALPAVSLLASGIAAAAPPPKVYRIGVLVPDGEVRIGSWNEFVAELKRHGYEEGRNVVFVRRFGDGSRDRPDLLDKNAAELAALKVDVIYASEGTLSALAAKKASRTIPIVFNSSADPVGFGVVASLSRPGGNVTGNSISSLDTIPKSLQLLCEAIGRRDVRIVLPQRRDTRELSWYPRLSAAVAAAAVELGASIEWLEVESFDEMEAALQHAARGGAGAVSMDFAQPFAADFERIAALLIRLRLPSIGNAAAGFLLQYQPSLLPLARKSAQYVDKILQGTKPADLPVEQTSAFELAINLKTAQALGLKLPAGLQVRAAELIR